VKRKDPADADTCFGVLLSGILCIVALEGGKNSLWFIDELKNIYQTHAHHNTTCCTNSYHRTGIQSTN